MHYKVTVLSILYWFYFLYSLKVQDIHADTILSILYWFYFLPGLWICLSHSKLLSILYWFYFLLTAIMLYGMAGFFQSYIGSIFSDIQKQIGFKNVIYFQSYIGSIFSCNSLQKQIFRYVFQSYIGSIFSREISPGIRLIGTSFNPILVLFSRNCCS